MVVHISTKKIRSIKVEKKVGKEKHCLQTEHEILLDKVLCGMSNVLKAMSDMTRLKILYTLSKSDCCVCQLQEILGASQSLVSHQLRFLKGLNLVKASRMGNRVVYSLADEHVVGLLDLAHEHTLEKLDEKNI